MTDSTESSQMSADDVLFYIKLEDHDFVFDALQFDEREQEEEAEANDLKFFEILAYWCQKDASLMLEVALKVPRFNADYFSTSEGNTYLQTKILGAKQKITTQFTLPSPKPTKNIVSIPKEPEVIAPHFIYMLERGDAPELVDGWAELDSLPGNQFYEDYARWMRGKGYHRLEILDRRPFGRILVQMFGHATTQKRIIIHGVKVKTRIFLVGNRVQYKKSVESALSLSHQATGNRILPPLKVLTSHPRTDETILEK